jgi:hypothetical protein
MSGGHLDEARLLALGLGEPASAAETEHLAACAQCAAGPAEDARLWAHLRQLAQPSPPPSFAGAALSRYRRARAVRHRPREVVLGSIVVVVLVGILGWWALQLAPQALVALALSLPRFADVVPRGIRWTALLGVVLPVMALAAAILLGSVGVMLRRLTAGAAK